MINFANLKKLLIYTLVACLILAASVAVITVLIGQFTQVTSRVFVTLFIAVIHSLVSLMFIWDDSRRDTFTRLSFFINTVFIIIVLSFFTCIFGVWKIVSGETIFHLYLSYFVFAFAALHADILSKAFGKEKYMDKVIYANYFFILVVIAMLQPIIHSNLLNFNISGMYYRFLGAAAIIDGTLSILTIIFHRLFMHKHPELENILAPAPSKDGQPARKGLHWWVWLLIIWLAAQIIVPLFLGITSLFYHRY